MKDDICSYCNRKVCKQDASFNFPKMPKWHEFYEMSEKVFHIECIKKIDCIKGIGKGLADITEKMALTSEDTPLLLRNNNIVVIGDMNEMAIEINDYEDFVQFNISIMNLDYIDDLQCPKVVQNKTTSLDFLQNGKVRLITLFYELELDFLTSLRLKQIVKEVKKSGVFNDINGLKRVITDKYLKE